MIAFQIRLNGKRLCQAGVGEDGVLTTTITYGHETRLYVGGLVMPKDEHVRWKHAVLHVGDEVHVKVIETDTVDKPRTRFPRDWAAIAKAEKRQLRLLAKKFGWKFYKPSKKRR